MTDLRLEAVSKVYRGTGAAPTVALDDVDLRVRDGEFFTLVGPSGCGKTTTLRTIAGFEEPTSGSVRFDGREMTGVPPEGRDVGVVFQSYALFPHMTVAENVGYGLRFRDPPAGTGTAERIDELLDLVDLEGLGERDPDQLSGGQQQRVALARALAPEPSLLLLDEPLSALDARLRERLRRQVARIQSELGITTVYVTHDQAEALAISDRVAVMSDGRVEQVGTPETIYRRPATRFVAEFVGDNNVFDGSVVDVDPDGLAVTVDDREFRIVPTEIGGNARDDYRSPGAQDGSGPSAEVAPGDRVAFCVRPEHLAREADENRFHVAVEMREFLGDASRVHGRWNDVPIVVRIDPDTADTDSLAVGFRPGDARVVDVERAGESTRER